MGNRQQLAQALSQQMQQGQSQGILAQPPSNVQQMPGGYGTSPQFRQLLGNVAGNTGPQAGVNPVFGEHPEVLAQRQAALLASVPNRSQFIAQRTAGSGHYSRAFEEQRANEQYNSMYPNAPKPQSPWQK